MSEMKKIGETVAQSKLIARLKDGHVALPLFGTPSTHIIKPPAEDYPDTVYNEAFAMARRIVASAHEVADELSATFPSSVYSAIISVVTHQVQTVARD